MTTRPGARCFPGTVWEEEQQPLGVVPVQGRGSLPFALVHGESLVAAATWALVAAEVEILDAATPVEELRGCSRIVVVHDPLCPLTPVAFIEEAVTLCQQSAAVVVGVRPVTDTVKRLEGQVGREHVGATLPREELLSIASPVALPPAAVAGLGTLEEIEDLSAWVARLAETYPVRFLQAPPLARRILDPEDLAVLEALSRSSAT